jgi:hypothetical protein
MVTSKLDRSPIPQRKTASPFQGNFSQSYARCSVLSNRDEFPAATLTASLARD